jgi:hypothetical protein
MKRFQEIDERFSISAFSAEESARIFHLLAETASAELAACRWEMATMNKGIVQREQISTADHWRYWLVLRNIKLQNSESPLNGAHSGQVWPDSPAFPLL